MFMQDCWYVAAWDNEISSDGLFARTIGDKAIVFWRSQDGVVRAFDDRCCHRGLPLSCGRREGDNVRCMYHGFLYDSHGICIEIPGQTRVQSGACVKSYAVQERHRWVWIWLGDPAAADVALIPDTHWLDDPDWACTPPGYLHYDVNYQFINDNLLDFSHLSFVHPTTLGGSEEYAQLRSKIEPLDRGLRITRWFMDRPAAPFVKALLDAKGMTGNVDRWNNYDFYLPGVLVMDSGFAVAGSGAERAVRTDAIQFRHCQAVTPETENTSHYFFAQPRDFDKDSPEVSQALFSSILTAFEEDRAIMTAQARGLAGDSTFKPLPCNLDVGLTMFRRLVSRQLDSEAAAKNDGAEGSPTTAHAGRTLPIALVRSE